MAASITSFPRTIPFGATQLQYSGPGRAPSSVVYYEPSNGRIRELLPARIAYTGVNHATAIFTNPNLPPAKINGNAFLLGLTVGSFILCEVSLAGSELSILHWFMVKAAPAPVPVPVAPKPPVFAPVVTAVITKVDPEFRYGFAETAAGQVYFVHPSEFKSGSLRLNAKVRFTPDRNEKGPIARKVMAA